MDIEAQLLHLTSRVEVLETGVRITDGIMATMIGITQVTDDVTQLRNEIRQDLAALRDEVAGLRRHMAEQYCRIQLKLPRTLNSSETETPRAPGSPSPETLT
ncbi:hypothetical protein [Nonomuraea rhodomycinica]|uniref:Uncharacterized protein n=1 Tax=Nonomuraea rhodomycinica TaxID=1712872 RepID=A0A7Y6ISL0_9ACTN|nr:hypothetical protein [Nonomuraea rhodomycinica]NUW43318.1 hypothetical protein [Nonomuraea rhodomycinica]